MPTSIQIPNVTPDRLQNEIDFWRAGGYQVFSQKQGDGNYLLVATKDLLSLSPGDGTRAIAAPAKQTKDVQPPPLASPNALRLLCVHGVGHQEADPNFKRSWIDAISTKLTGVPLEIEFVDYDQAFADEDLSGVDLAEALFRLSASGLFHGVGDVFRRSRGFGDVPDQLSWTAGMVAKWAEDPESMLRRQTRQAVAVAIQRFQPHAVLAHSLGTLICYDLFRRKADAALIEDRVFVSFGSQIGNPFVRDQFGGRIDPLPVAKRWFHLFNPHDNAFTARIRLNDPKFQQVMAEFDIEGMLDHDATEYLRHASTTSVVWPFLAQGMTPGARAVQKAGSAVVSRLTASLQKKKASAVIAAKPEQRALLVGINDYPDPANQLEGCVNDVFLMSSVLQECGFLAENIRVVLNDRATAAGVLERLEWLLDGAGDEQNRVLYYSGHGAQIPTYGPKGEADRVDECLVTYDFDWTRSHAIVDNQFYELYSQLPESAHFLAVFDCCHSGGMTRDGSARVRGLTPPDDIRHRALEWDAENEMWRARLAGFEKKNNKGVSGSSDVCKLGHRSRQKNSKAYRPILIEACQEKEYSYEYRHGVTAYGAFTYSLAKAFREERKEFLAGRRKQLPSWSALIKSVTKTLHALEYNQTPVLVCPEGASTKPIPWTRKL